VLDELGAGHKPRVVAYNKVDLVEAATGRAFSIPHGDRHAVGIAALDGRGLDGLRTTLGSVLAEMWVEVDLTVPYTAGSLLARLRERGAVDFEYRDTEVRVHGRVDQALAGELVQAARSWRRVVKEAGLERLRAGSPRATDDDQDPGEQVE